MNYKGCFKTYAQAAFVKNDCVQVWQLYRRNFALAWSC